MHASSCSSSLEENTANLYLYTRTWEHLVRLTIRDRSTGRRCACLDPDCSEEPPEHLRICANNLAREGYLSDEKTSSGCPLRQ